MAEVKRQVTITAHKYGGTIVALKDAVNALAEELDQSGGVAGTPTFTVEPSGKYAWSKVRIGLRTVTSVVAD